MIRPLLSTLLLAVAVSASAQIVASRDGGRLTIRGGFGGYKRNPDRSERYILNGTSGQPASVVQKTDTGTMQISAEKELDITVKTQGGRQVVTVAKATGNVRVQRTLDKDGSVTNISGSQADYARNGSQGTLEMDGPVEIVRTDAAKNRKLVAKGKHAQAILLPDSAADSLRTATLTGNVTVNVDQAPYKDPETGKVDAGGQYEASGGKLVYDLTGEVPVLTLTENVRLQGLTPDKGTTSTGISSLVLTLNKSGELTDAEATGGPVETVVTPKKSGGR